MKGIEKWPTAKIHAVANLLLVVVRLAALLLLGTLLAADRPVEGALHDLVLGISGL